MTEGSTATEERRGRVWIPIVAVACWFALWYLTPGLHGFGIGVLAGADGTAGILLETAVAAAVLALLLLLNRRRARAMFAPQLLMLAYAVPLIAAAVLFLHFQLGLPIAVYLVWITVSVVWQDVLTFGLLQDYLRRLAPVWRIATVSVVFALGHIVYLPDRFGADQPLAAVAMLAVGAALAGLRVWTRTVHLGLALHLTFYFVFA